MVAHGGFCSASPTRRTPLISCCLNVGVHTFFVAAHSHHVHQWVAFFTRVLYLTVTGLFWNTQHLELLFLISLPTCGRRVRMESLVTIDC